ncbi:MAG: DUF370 domain-containing protein [Desulfovibrionaceae bacterium]|nr:DUF370 domain-containing protein [Desulfovibrionaceae bacterium]
MEDVVHIGFSTYIMRKRIICVLPPTSAPMRRIREEAKESGMLIDATQGRKTRCIIVMDTNHVILSSLQPETIQQRIVESK